MTVYFIRPVGQLGPVKVGFTTAVSGRLRKLGSDVPFPIEVAAECDGDEMLERRFHALFFDLRTHGEWFNASPRIDSVIEAIRAGAFDFSTLPEPRMLPHRRRKADGDLAAPKLASILGISLAYAYQVLNGTRGISKDRLARLWRDHRWKVGILKNATDADCDAFVRIMEGAGLLSQTAEAA
jgi:hypothetical protein